MSNLYSMAQSRVYIELIPKAIYSDDKLIGFSFHKYMDNEPKHIFFKRFMIDKTYQGMGYGKGSMLALIEHFKNNCDIEFIELMHYPENTVAAGLYEKCGFVPTGEIRETEIVRRHYL